MKVLGSNLFIEQITWQPVADGLPDTTRNVLVKLHSGVVWIGYFDRHRWLAADGMPMVTGVAQWSEMPKGAPE